jgi:hypothetical protein
MEDLLFLAMGKLDIKHPAVGFDDGQGVKFSYGCPIGQAAEVPPIDLHLLAGSGFEADEGLLASAPLMALSLEIRPDNGYPAVESLFFEPLENHWGLNVGKLFQKRINHLPVSIQF